MKRTSYVGIILSLCLLTGCGSQISGAAGAADPTASVAADQAQSVQLFAMDTTMKLTAYGSHAEEGLAAARQAIETIEQEVSVTDPESEIYWVNHHAGQSLRVSEDTANLVQNALAMGQRTNGALDLSIYPIVSAWGFTTEKYQIPSQSTLKTLLKSVDYTKVRYNADTRSLSVPSGMQIDLGATAKGYAGQRAIEAMRAAGVTAALINLGGNVQAIGSKPDGAQWRVAVDDPEDTAHYAGVISMKNKAVITSGGYERYFIGADGKKYCHIMDPKTGSPARTDLLSVSIVCDSGTLGDSMSTSLFVMGLEQASAHWRKYHDFEAVFITEDHRLYITEGLRDHFTAMGSYQNTPVTVIVR